MCQQETADKAKKNDFKHNKLLWPLPLHLVLAALLLLPQTLFINRGYTRWFHVLGLVYLLTEMPFLRKILILQGAGICTGWYSAVLYEVASEGTFFHTLYRHSPNRHTILIETDDGGYEMLENTWSCVGAKFLAHVLDFIVHPGFLWLFYYLHLKAGGSLRDVTSWKIIVPAWNLSRAWSLFHSYYNQGVFALWYFGHDVYKLKSLDSYHVAYVAEVLCFLVAIGYRLYEDNEKIAISDLSESMEFEVACYMTPRKEREDCPGMVHSDSSASTSSMM